MGPTDMTRSALNKIADVVVFTGLAVLATTGVLLRYQLPPGSGQLHGAGTGSGAGERPVLLLWGDVTT